MKWSNWIAVAALMAASANAQNLVNNSSFDVDDGADGWVLSSNAAWSGRVDHGNSISSGALQISTRTSDNASQCVDVRANTQYVIKYWNELDPQPSFAPCGTPTFGLGVRTFEGPQCTGQEGVRFLIRKIDSLHSWQQSVVVSNAVQTNGSMRVTLNGSCDSSDGVAIQYFDDVVVETDDVFGANFEDHDG